MSAGSRSFWAPVEGAAAVEGLRGGRAPRQVLVGAVLMFATALLFALVALRADAAVPVLAVAAPVAAGEVITDRHLQVVRVVPDSRVQVVSEAERPRVVGQPAAVPLAAGSLLTAGQVGAVVWPPAGESVIALPVAPGRAPAGLTTGSKVTVIVASAEASGAEPLTASASVLAWEARPASGVTVVSLLLPSAQARRVASAGGDIVLVLESPNTGR